MIAVAEHPTGASSLPFPAHVAEGASGLAAVYLPWTSARNEPLSAPQESMDGP
jgi:hypothetical protein